MNRRHFLATSSTAALASCTALPMGKADALIIDTHQHLWDPSKISPPWLKAAPPVLAKTYRTAEYDQAFAGLNVRSIYMEVDVAPKDHEAEADSIIALCRARSSSTIAATIGGRPDAQQFASYVAKYAAMKEVKGLRQVLHGASTPAGHCLRPEFVKGIQTLGQHGLNFELTMRPTELLDGARLTELCPDTRFVIDHCGNGDPKAFNAKLAPKEKRSCTASEWQRGIDALAKRPNVICKISGIVAFVPPGKWSAADLAPVVNHCLDAFGPERVVFGGDWPVCLLGSPVRGWVDALREIIASRPESEQRRLWSRNAIRFYGLTV